MSDRAFRFELEAGPPATEHGAVDLEFIKAAASVRRKELMRNVGRRCGLEGDAVWVHSTGEVGRILAIDRQGPCHIYTVVFYIEPTGISGASHKATLRVVWRLRAEEFAVLTAAEFARLGSRAP